VDDASFERVDVVGGAEAGLAPGLLVACRLPCSTALMPPDATGSASIPVNLIVVPSRPHEATCGSPSRSRYPARAEFMLAELQNNTYLRRAVAITS
jgi:hypothetical protein